MSRLFGKAVHAAFVVPDLEREMRRLLTSGEGPFFVMRGIRVASRYRGRRHDPLFSAAFVYSGEMQYEFVEQHDDTPSAYREFLLRHPEGGLHHLAYFCKSFEEAFRSAEERGTKFQVVQEFIYPDDSPYELYIEPAEAPDPVLMQLMIPSPVGSLFDSMHRIAADWDGREPIRDALAMLPVEMRPPVEPVPGAHR
jgi:Glyoxalase/Bleomycin resistance protein/Dioxygenase superfamily